MLYAIGEIDLVVIGIMIALQINNWNEWIKDRKQEKISLENLLKEHDTNITQIDEKIIGSQDRIRIDSLLLTLFKSNKEIFVDEEIERMLAAITSPITFDPGNGVIKDLINSAKTNLVRNNRLKFMISEWESNLAEVKEAEQFLLELSIMQLNNYLIEKTAVRNAYVELVGKGKFEHDSRMINDRKLENLIVGSLLNLKLLEDRYLIIREEMS